MLRTSTPETYLEENGNFHTFPTYTVDWIIGVLRPN